MKYVFRDAVFSKQENKLKILALLEEAIDKRIYIDVEDENGEYYIEWRSQCLKDFTELWDIMLDWTVRDEILYPLEYIIIDDITDSNWDAVPRLNLTDARDLARNGISFIIENGRNDRAFIFSMLDKYTREQISYLENKGVIRFIGLGGIGEIKAHLDEFVVLKSHKSHSYFIMIDSDAEVPGVISDAAKRVCEICKDNKIPYYCLKRRAIENYIPVSTIFDYINASKKSYRPYLRDLGNALKKLNVDQRAHFPMKSGIKKFSGPQSYLYGALDQQTLGYLGRRFPEKLASSVFSDKPSAHLERQIDNDSGKDEVRVMVADMLRYVRGPYA